MFSTALDYRQKLLDEIGDLSPQEMEKVYQFVVFLKEEFLAPEEARYHTQSWLQAEQEATDAYVHETLKAYDSVDEMIQDILAEDQEQ